MNYTVEEAFRALSYDDHAIFGEEEAKAIASAFGVGVTVGRMTDTRNTLKGATLPGATKAGQKVSAIGGVALMEQIVGALGGNAYAGSQFFGYGRTYRALLAELHSIAGPPQ